ncbi:MAG: DUF190 domain-containing protein [Henriciella sp.]|nr:DUF190 domain-containing protein [Henriciella sp.]
MYQRKRIELIIEKMAHKRAGRIFESCGMTGYTVLPALAGYGGGNRWSRDTDISASRDMVVIISIGDVARVTETMTQLEDLLGEHIGVVTVSDVEVLRPDRF